MMNINIYLPIEIKRRELYSRIYFAIYASMKGYQVTLGRKTKFHDFYKYIEPGNYISKSLGKGNFDHLKKLKKTADRMKISVKELNEIRRRTLDNARKTISSRQSSKETKEPMTRATDVNLIKE